MTSPSESMVPDIYFVIAGSEEQFRRWHRAMLIVLEEERRLKEVKPDGFVAHIPHYQKTILYKYIPVNQPKKTRGCLRWSIIPIGSWRYVWSEENLAWLTQAMIESMRAH